MSDIAKTLFPVRLQEDTHKRISWDKNLYDVEILIVFPDQAKTQTEIQNLAEDLQLMLTLTPFRAAFRNKMLASLGRSDDLSEPEPLQALVRVNLLEEKFLVLETLAKLTEEGPAPLTNEKKDLFRSAIVNYLQRIYHIVKEPFVPFFPKIQNEWKKRNLLAVKPSTLVPIGVLLPGGVPFEAETRGTEFYLDDLYCTTPNCDCTDVTCLIMRLDPGSEKEALWAGFKYDVKTKKIKTMAEFTVKYNPKELLKTFENGYPFDLSLTLKARYDFVRNEFIQARKEAALSQAASV